MQHASGHMQRCKIHRCIDTPIAMLAVGPGVNLSCLVTYGNNVSRGVEVLIFNIYSAGEIHDLSRLWGKWLKSVDAAKRGEDRASLGTFDSMSLAAEHDIAAWNGVSKYARAFQRMDIGIRLALTISVRQARPSMRTPLASFCAFSACLEFYATVSGSRLIA